MYKTKPSMNNVAKSFKNKRTSEEHFEPGTLKNKKLK